MDYEKYKNKKPYPSRDGVTCECSATYSLKYSEKFCPKCGFKISDKIEAHKNENKKILEEYQNEDGRIMEQFVSDLYEEHGVKPGAVFKISVEDIYSLAWEEGHSSGLSSVASAFGTIMSQVEDNPIES